jgi:threonine dehydrogenase-like Zn-dependent dehydrogenase
MQALTVERGSGRPTLRELPRPEPGPGEALVRTLRVGVDATDADVLAGAHGRFPEDEEYMILGHEAVGVVESAPADSELAAGQPVVPTVRRRAGAGEDGALDMAAPEDCLERGIAGAHGFMAEYFTSPVETLVPVPRAVAPAAFLVEPVSVVEKALSVATASRSAVDWSLDSAFVLGAGSLGLVGLAALADRGVDPLYCLDRRERPDPAVDIVERLGATYVDGRETPVTAFAERHDPVDLLVEATGHAPHAVEAVSALAPGGVAALLGLPDSDRQEVDLGRLHRDLVMYNRALVGSVNAGVRHYRRAVETLVAFPAWLRDRLAADVFAVTDYEAAFDARADGGQGRPLKTAVEFDTL